MVRKDALGLLREHPDWFQKGMDGKVLGTADEEQYLDPTHPGARKFIRAMIRNARAEAPICILEAIRCLGQTSALNQVLLANDPDVTYLKPRDTLTEEELCTSGMAL